MRFDKLRTQFVVDEKFVKARYGGERTETGASCKLCGRQFEVGDKARWIYCNSTPGQGTGNFFVCSKCDGSDAEVMARAKASLEEAIRVAKQWNIYGPDWAKGPRLRD